MSESSYAYHDASLGCHHAYLLPFLLQILDRLNLPLEQRRLFDLGCGSGAVCDFLYRQRGMKTVGVDHSESGIQAAKSAFPNLAFYKASAYDDLASQFGRFPVVLSLEVVEHLYYPRQFARSVFSLLEEGGTAIISTPYHGYWKNLALALTDKYDLHLNPLWDHGHIKFWSMKTLGALLHEAGLSEIRFVRVGRIPPLAKSMLAIAHRPRSAESP